MSLSGKKLRMGTLCLVVHGNNDVKMNQTQFKKTGLFKQMPRYIRISSHSNLFWSYDEGQMKVMEILKQKPC